MRIVYQNVAGLDVHKKTISYCVKDASGQVHREGRVRKMVAYLLAVDRGQRDFVPFVDPQSAAA